MCNIKDKCTAIIVSVAAALRRLRSSATIQDHRLTCITGDTRAVLVTLGGVVAVPLFPLELALALFIYIGCQVAFSLGNYLMRCEALLMVSVEQLCKFDVAKQASYLLGMGGGWAVYAGLEQLAGIDGRVERLVSLHWVLAIIELAVMVAL